MNNGYDGDPKYLEHNGKRRTEWSNKSMRLKPDTRYIMEYIKNANHFTDNEMVEYCLLSLVFINRNNIRFDGFARTQHERTQFYGELEKHYRVTNNGKFNERK